MKSPEPFDPCRSKRRLAEALMDRGRAGEAAQIARSIDRAQLAAWHRALTPPSVGEKDRA